MITIFSFEPVQCCFIFPYDHEREAEDKTWWVTASHVMSISKIDQSLSLHIQESQNFTGQGRQIRQVTFVWP